ncbi:MAG: autotransporter domain-containing protein [Hyphomicrobiales bacterium]
MAVRALVATSPAAAQCSPTAGPGTPVPGTTVTCNGTASNQNPGAGVVNGYGDGSQAGITINVQPSAIVTGSFVGPVGPPFITGNGIAVGNGNTMNLLSGTAPNQTQVTGSSNNGGGNGILAGDNNQITVNANATVTGTSFGINVGSNNTITNFGTLTTAGIGGVGDESGINAGGDVTVINSGTIGNLNDGTGISSFGTVKLTNNSTGLIQAGPNSAAAAVEGGDVQLVANTGQILGATGAGVGGSVGIVAAASVTGTNSLGGTILGNSSGIQGNTIDITNNGTITSADSGGTTLNGLISVTLANTGTVQALDASGNGGTFGIFAPTVTITSNTGTISAAGLASIAVSNGSGTLSVTNNSTGTISAVGVASTAVLANSGTVAITNMGQITASGNGSLAVSIFFSSSYSIGNSGTISGEAGIVVQNSTGSVTNSGTISSTLGGTGTAIQFCSCSSADTLTLEPGSIIIGKVLAETGSDIFQLGGSSGADTFNISNIGAFPSAAQYQGFVTFNKVGTSTWTLTGTGAQDWTIEQGTLAVNASLTGSVAVQNGGILKGTGTIANSVAIASGATLAPGGVASPGTLTIGSLTLNSGALLSYRLGTSGVVGGATNDLTHVTNALTLAGTLNVTDSGGFSLGAYRLFDYGGAFTNNGLAIGSLPASFTGVLQTAIAGQVNLVVTGPGAPVQFWDGATTTGDGVVHGGTGTWNNALTNWTTPNGGINSNWQSGFGIFAGAAGTVTATAPIAYQGLQFSTDGYVLTATGAGALTPTGQAPIRVDQGVTATIDAPITGAGGVAKSDPGTLILAGANTYTGGTGIAGGVLAVSADNNLGAASGGLTFTGAGTLRFLAGFTSNRNIVVNAAGAFDTNGNNDTLSGFITGAGGFTKLGAGTLTLTGASSYSGATLVNVGTLQAGVGHAFSASSAFTVASGAIVDLDNFAQGIGSLAGAGKVMLGSATLTTGLDATSTSFSGTITGSGGLIKAGAGTFTLSGVDTYAGGTNVQGGTLAVTNANAVGPGPLVLQNGTTLALAGSFTFANTITIAGDPTFEVDGANVSAISSVIADGALPGALDKTGTGTLILSAANTYTGRTIVDAGTLAVNGSIASPFVDVDNGGTLAGSGTIAGSVNVRSGGTVAPGVLAPFTTLNISGVGGNVIFAAGSNFLVNVNAAGQNDKLLVGGPAILQGGTVQVNAANGVYSPFTRYTILTANAGVNGIFAQLTTTSNLAFLTPLLSYDANDVFLGFTQTVTPAGTPVAFSSVAATRNQASIAAAVQALGLGNPLFNAVVGQNAAGARQAFDALSGEIHASAVTAAFEDARLPREAILDRLNQPIDTPVLGAASTMTGAYAADLPSGKGPALAPVEVRMYEPRIFGLWGQGFGDWGHTSSNRNAASLDRSTGGFMLGGDVGVRGFAGGDWRFGVAGGYTNDQIDVRQRLSSGSFESVFGGLYGGASFGAVQLRTGLVYGVNTTSTSRTIVFPGFADAAGSSYGGSTAQAFGEAGYRIGFSGLNVLGMGLSRASLEPFVGAAAIHIHQNGFTEAGGAAALTGFGRSYDLATTTIGLRAETSFAGALPVTLRALLGWRHGFGDVVPAALMAFQGGAQAFSIGGVPIDRNALVAEAGLDYAVSSMVTLGVSYSGQYGKRATDNAFKGHLDVSFESR